jgi:3-phytase
MLPLINPTLFTERVQFDSDDPAILYNAQRPEKSLIVGTDKEKAPGGGIYVFNLEGRIVGKYLGIDRPNNVDSFVPSQLPTANKHFFVLTERYQSRLRVFSISQDGTIEDMSGKTDVFVGQVGEDKEPMGIACFGDEVFVTPKAGSLTKHIEKLRLVFNPQSGKFDAVSISKFGNFSGKKETESLVVDPILKRVYYSDELVGIWSYSLDHLTSPLRLIKNSDHQGDHEGLALTEKYLVSTDQRKGGSYFWLYDRWNLSLKGGFRTPLDETDGIDICTRPMGPKFPKGIMVGMNSAGRNFGIFDLRQLPK